MNTETQIEWPNHNEIEESTPRFGPFTTAGAEVFFEPRGTQLYIHWRARTAADLIEAIEQARDTLQPQAFSLYIEFVPPEFEAGLLAAGFQAHSEYMDAWIRNLGELDLSAPGKCAIRPVTPQDYSSAAAITRACAGTSRGFGGDSAEWVAEWLGEPGRAAFLASKEDRLAGVVFCGLYHSSKWNTEVLWLRELAVRPETQGQGVGRELTLAALRWGRGNGAGRSFLAVDRENRAAIHLYESLGYYLNDGRGQINLEKTG